MKTHRAKYAFHRRYSQCAVTYLGGKKNVFKAGSERPASEACGGCAEGTAIVMAVERA
jgi:hypothetical protein